jgi:hypothetical protein
LLALSALLVAISPLDEEIASGPFGRTPPSQ